MATTIANTLMGAPAVGTPETTTTQARTFTLRQIGKELKFSIPPYQRAKVWPDTAKSKLLDSLYRGLPVGAATLCPDGQGGYIIIDGQQRITTIQDFYKDDLKLVKGAVKKGFLADEHYTTLEKEVREKFDAAVLPVVIVPLQEEEHLEAFRDINNLGCEMSGQEIRDGSKDDPLTTALMDAAGHPAFVSLCGKIGRKPRANRGDDRQIVLQALMLKELPADEVNKRKDKMKEDADGNKYITFSRQAMDNYMTKYRQDDKANLLASFKAACDKINQDKKAGFHPKTAELYNIIAQEMTT